MDDVVNQSEELLQTADSSRPQLSLDMTLTATGRWISFGEFVVGASIVIGHNVYHVIPNEVPILFVVGLVSLRVREGGWGVIGLHWPKSWTRTVMFALAAAATRILLGKFVTDPLTAHFWHPAIAPSVLRKLRVMDGSRCAGSLSSGPLPRSERRLATVATWSRAVRTWVVGRRPRTGLRSCWYQSCLDTGTTIKDLREW
jgi:hypothetical protein